MPMVRLQATSLPTSKAMRNATRNRRRPLCRARGSRRRTSRAAPAAGRRAGHRRRPGAATPARARPSRRRPRSHRARGRTPHRPDRRRAPRRANSGYCTTWSTWKRGSVRNGWLPRIERPMTLAVTEDSTTIPNDSAAHWRRMSSIAKNTPASGALNVAAIPPGRAAGDQEPDPPLVQLHQLAERGARGRSRSARSALRVRPSRRRRCTAPRRAPSPPRPAAGCARRCGRPRPSPRARRGRGPRGRSDRPAAHRGGRRRPGRARRTSGPSAGQVRVGGVAVPGVVVVAGEQRGSAPRSCTGTPPRRGRRRPPPARARLSSPTRRDRSWSSGGTG